MKHFLINTIEKMQLKAQKILLFILLLGSFSLYGQEKHHVVEADYQNSKVEMADQFRADGKIYVVVAVASIILAGLFFYAFRLDRKITNLEKEVGSKNVSKKAY